MAERVGGRLATAVVSTPLPTLAPPRECSRGGRGGDLAEAALDLLPLEELDHVVLAAVFDLLVCRTCGRVVSRPRERGIARLSGGNCIGDTSMDRAVVGIRQQSKIDAAFME
jgi:hypothetical protein